MDNELASCFKWLASSTAFVFESVLDGVTSFSYINMFFVFLYIVKLYLRFIIFYLLIKLSFYNFYKHTSTQ